MRAKMLQGLREERRTVLGALDIVFHPGCLTVAFGGDLHDVAYFDGEGWQIHEPPIDRHRTMSDHLAPLMA